MSAAIPPVFSPPILHLDAHHWWPTVSSLGKSVWANRCSCVGSPSLRTTGAGLSSTVIYSSILSSASSGHDFTPVPPTVSSASQLLLTRSSTSQSLFSTLNGGVFVTTPIKRRNIDLRQVHHAFLHLQALRLTYLRCCGVLSISASRTDVVSEASTSVFGDSAAVLSTLPC